MSNVVSLSGVVTRQSKEPEDSPIVIVPGYMSGSLWGLLPIFGFVSVSNARIDLIRLVQK